LAGRGTLCYSAIRQATNKSNARLWFAVAGFLVLPLANLAMVAFAMAWNRHRQAARQGIRLPRFSA
jgi:hypothetical protein